MNFPEADYRLCFRENCFYTDSLDVIYFTKTLIFMIAKI